MRWALAYGVLSPPGEYAGRFPPGEYAGRFSLAYTFPMRELYTKQADLLTPLQPHQQRVIEKLKASHGVLVAHGLGSGKCGRGQTRVFTSKGLLPLQELFGDQAQGDEAELTLDGGGLSVASLVDGAFVSAPVRARYRQRLPNDEHTLKVRTARGHGIEVTLAHPMLVIRGGVPTWVSAGALVEGDILGVPAALPEIAADPGIDPRLSELLAWQVTEGYENAEHSWTAITQDDLPVLKHLAFLFAQLYTRSDSGHIRGRGSSSHCPFLHIACVAYRRDLEALGYTWGRKSAKKAFPASFLHLPLPQLRTLLQCVFEAEGHAGRLNIEITSASLTLISQIEYMLLRFGVRSARHVKWACATNGTRIKRKYYRLFISGEDYERFNEQVGFRGSRKQADAESITAKRNPNFGIPIRWLTDEFAAWGIKAAVLGVANKGHAPTVARYTAEAVVSRLRWLGSPEGISHYAGQARRLGGTAGAFSQRTYAVLQAHSERILDLAATLDALLALPLRYEPIESISLGEQGGFVYDLSIDAEKYDHQNYVAGSGGFVLHNTLTSIAAKDALDEPLDAIVPAPLVPNYNKEFIKHTGRIPGDARVRSYEKALKDRDVRLDGLAVMDEAHKARNADTGIARHIAGQVAKAKNRLLLTGTPVYNQPEDLATLLNTAAGRKVLPDDPTLFKSTFVGTKTIQAPLWDRIKGQVLGHPVDNVTLPALVNRSRLVDAATGYVDVHQGGGDNFPRRVNEHYDVPLGETQQELYKFHEGKMPWYLRAKIRAGLPLDKAESKDLNAFQGALRQVSNTARAYTPTMTDAQEIEDSAKLKQMLTHLNEMRASNPDHRGIVYSNYLESGVNPLSRALTAQGVPHHVFTGAATPIQRKTMVEDYNSGKVPLLLLSGAGSEGLDLKGTRSIQLMEPHWNPSRIEQVIGRGIRYKSHDHLPDKDREVRVMTYHSTLPKDVLDRAGEFLLGSKPKKSIEQYLSHMSEQKAMLSKEIADALQEASDRGPLKPRGKFGAAGASFDDVVNAMDGVSVVQQKRKKLLRYRHPSGVTLDSEYNPGFANEQLHSTFAGKPEVMAQQLQDDLLNMGYASLGQLDKTNEKNRIKRSGTWAGWGSLAGIPAYIAVAPKIIQHGVLPVMARAPRLGKALLFGSTALGPSLGAIAGGTLGWHLGKATYKPLGIEDMTASNKHPLLIPPKVVKPKVKLEVTDK